MLQWSKYFQSPAYLELYRKMIMNPDYANLIAKWVSLENHFSVLDVGCGTGAFSYYLSSQTNSSDFYGIDIDEQFIRLATEKANNECHNANRFHFSVANALSMPFADNSFDLVVSYTALTNIPNGKRVMDEMIRVVKKGGTVASITAQSFSFTPQFEGIYPPSHRYYYEYKNLTVMVLRMYESIQPISDYTQYGVAPEKVPTLFANSALHDIEMHPIGNAFSLSNAHLSNDDKRSIINLMYQAEHDKFCAYMALEQSRHFISHEQAERYLRVLELRKDALLSDIGENKIWEWFGGAQILMCGKK